MTENQASFNEDLAAQLAAEFHDPDAFGDVPVPREGSGNKQREYEFVRLVKKSGSSTGAQEGNFWNSTRKEEYPSVFATLLYVTPSRKIESFVDNKPVYGCRSFDGEYPAVRIKEPVCGCASQEQVEQILSTFKLEKAKVVEIAGKVCYDGKLVQCGYKNPTNGAIYPLCPAARSSKTPTGKYIAPDCKLETALFFWDHERKVQFRVDLSSQSETRARAEFISPFMAFLGMVHQKKIPMFYWQFLLKAAKDPKGFYVLDFVEPVLVEDAELRLDLSRRAADSKNKNLYQQGWMPKPKGSESEKEQSGSESEE